MLLVRTLPALSKVQPDLVMLVTVNVYVPRLPLVLNFARPLEPVVAVCVTVVPPGLVHVAETVAPASAAPAPFTTAMLPVMVALLP